MPAEQPDCVPCAPPLQADPGIKAFGFRIGLSLAFAGQGMVFSLGYNNALKAGEAPAAGSFIYWILHGGLILSVIAVGILLGRPLLRQTMRAIAEFRLSVEALFVLSGCGAFAGSLISTVRGTGSIYYEVVSIVFCVYAIGRQIGVIQKGRVAQAISSFRHAFDFATVEESAGGTVQKPVSEVRSGDRVLVHPGDPIAVDGVIIQGTGYIRETALTGEPVPVTRKQGDQVLAGTWSLDGNFIISPNTDDSRIIDRIINILDNPTSRVSRLQETADRLIQLFVPVVCATAVATFLVWLLVIDAVWWDALFNSMAVLLVACPCALGLAMPAGIWGGLYHLSQRGIVGRNGHLIDTLAEADRIVFDKTGTLTEFDLEADLSPLVTGDLDQARFLGNLSSIARLSQHPVSEAVARLAAPVGQVSGMVVHPGQGIEATVDGTSWLIGEQSLLIDKGIAAGEIGEIRGKPVYVARDHVSCGALLLRERLRRDAEASLEALQSLGCSCHILSGDPAPVLTTISGLDVRSGLSPDEKADYIRNWARSGDCILFVGDGVNDLPAMQLCDASLAIDMGAAIATEFADGLLVQGRIATLPAAVRFARKLKKSLSGNMKFALVYNLIGMALAAAGALHPVVAALLMVGSSFVVSLRALRVSEVSH